MEARADEGAAAFAAASAAEAREAVAHKAKEEAKEAPAEPRRAAHMAPIAARADGSEGDAAVLVEAKPPERLDSFASMGEDKLAKMRRELEKVPSS